jgi:uncharacterized coiled-coil protein SlyX
MTIVNEDSAVNKPTLSGVITLGNLINLLPLLLVLITGSMAYGQLTLRMENMETYRVERARLTDGKFEAITKVLEKIPNLEYRVIAQEEALKATNQRVDHSLQNISQRLAEINQALGSLDTKVAVLTQRLEMSDGKKAQLEPLEPRLRMPSSFRR